MINFEAARSRYPLGRDNFVAYIRNDIRSPLSPEKIAINYLVGPERCQIKTLTTGNASLCIFYDQKEVAVISWGQANEFDLVVAQIQGAKSRKSYRGNQGLRRDSLFADETLALATIPETGIARVCMPNAWEIEGVDADNIAFLYDRYNAFALLLALRWSQEEQMFVRDIDHK